MVPGSSAKASQGLAGLYPGYFAMVMATGTVSSGLSFLGHAVPARILLGINVAAYLLLWLLYLIRLARYPARVVEDFISHARGPGYFTCVAATCVLGTQLIFVADTSVVSMWLWWLGCILWAIVMYGFFTAVIVRRRKPSLQAGLGGGWLLAAVATESISVLATLLAVEHGHAHPELVVVAVVAFLLGGMLYLNIMPLLFYRLTFLRLEMDDTTPPYWINMGAVAITTLAGSVLLQHAAGAPLVAGMLPFVRGFTMFFWAAASFWIPLLIALGLWRVLYLRRPIGYAPQDWTVVFPIAMYGVGTGQLGAALDQPFLVAISQGFGYLALAVWVLVFLRLLMSLGRSSLSRTPGGGRSA